MAEKKKRVLAVASKGGHWVQLLRVIPAVEDQDVIFASTDAGYRDQTQAGEFYSLPDGNRSNKLGLLMLAWSVFWLVVKTRPSVVISTGAAPGMFAIAFGKLIGCRTIWIDSIANAEEMSMSGLKVRRFADLWLTQWPHVAQRSGATYAGAVI